MLIPVHVGAHKTGSTYIQSALERSRSPLGAAGVGYLPLDQMRSTITRRLGLTGLKLGSHLRRTLEENANCDVLILSDENILGRPTDADRFGQFYVQRRRRLGRLIGNLRSHSVRLFCAVRSYDSFISSMYVEYIRHRPFMAPGEFLRRIDVDAFCWVDVVGTLVRAVGGENVTTWRYEDFAAVEMQVFAGLTDGHSDLVTIPHGRVRESLSGQAVTQLVALQGAMSAEQIQLRVDTIAEAYPKASGNPSFSAFDADAAGKLRERYNGDISRLIRRFPAMTMLG